MTTLAHSGYSNGFSHGCNWLKMDKIMNTTMAETGYNNGMALVTDTTIGPIMALTLTTTMAKNGYHNG